MTVPKGMMNIPQVKFDRDTVDDAIGWIMRPTGCW